MIESFLICDADTHISPYKVPDKKLSREDLVASMKKNNVDYSLCWLYPHGVDNVSESNDYVGETAAMDQHLIPFGWVNIREGHDKALKDAAICFDKLVNTANRGLCFRPLSPPLEVSARIVWKKYQVFSPAAEVFLENINRRFSPDHAAQAQLQ